MLGFQTEKKLVRGYYDALDHAPDAGITSVLEAYTASSYTWRGYHPFGLQTDAKHITEVFWHPLRHAVTHLQRRMDVFFAGHSVVGDKSAVWVCSMGHLMGLFDHPWLGIRPTGKLVMLRYAEFHKVVDGKIAETAFYFDIPHLMMQAG
ncbi:MAG: nuclear transport factor 2 family protein, partial [Paracoccaceae bacterium]